MLYNISLILKFLSLSIIIVKITDNQYRGYNLKNLFIKNNNVFLKYEILIFLIEPNMQ